MEGYMNKWTNYISGWKPRYFMLNQGILSYYLSCEEVGAGCRGSMRIIHCRTISHPYDHCRLDIVLPSKRCLYLKASTPSERQQWLVALANAKMESEDRKLEVTGNTWVDKNVDVKMLKDKRNELDANRQQLLRQISALKTEMETVTKSNTDEMKRIQSVSLLISSTCDKMLSTFDECLSITNVMLSELADGSEPLCSLSSISPSSSPFLPRLPAPRPQTSHLSSATPQEVTEKAFPSPPSYLHPVSSLTQSNSVQDSSSPSPSCYEACVTHLEGTISPPHPTNALTLPPIVPGCQLNPICQRIGSIIIPSQPGNIQLECFLELCNHIPELVIQMFGSICMPLKNDIMGNIKKIETKHKLLNEEHKTLNDLILAEVQRDEHKADISATVGLLWLKRCLHLTQKFLSCIANDNMSPMKAIETAYEVSLMPHHNWVVKGIFYLFLKQATFNLCETFCKNEPSREHLVLSQMKYISQGLSGIISIIDELYLINNLI